jgi:hypothetical protein
VPLDSDGVYDVVSRNMAALEKEPGTRKALIVVSDGLISSGSRAEKRSCSKVLLETAR